MRFEVYGKQNCVKCESTKNKLTHLVGKAGLGEAVEVAFVDMDTVMGRADGAFYDVDAVPTTIARSPRGDEVGRWAGVIPPATAVRDLLGAAAV